MAVKQVYHLPNPLPALKDSDYLMLSQYDAVNGHFVSVKCTAGQIKAFLSGGFGQISCDGATDTLIGNADIISQHAHILYAELDGIEITGFHEGGLFDIEYATGGLNSGQAKVKWDWDNNYYQNLDGVNHRILLVVPQPKSIVLQMFPDITNPTLNMEELSWEELLEKYPNAERLNLTNFATVLTFCLAPADPAQISCAGATSTFNYELTLNSSWNSNCYIDLVINDEVFHLQINPPDAYAAWAVFANHINSQFTNRLQANWVSGNTGSVTVKTNEQFRIKATIVSDSGQSVGLLQFVDNGLNPTVSNFTGDQNFIPYSTVCLAPAQIDPPELGLVWEEDS